MVIKLFVSSLLLFSILSYFIPVENNTKKNEAEDIALLTFVDSTMYTLTPVSLNRIVNSKEALRYKNKDVMHDGVLTLKGKDSNNKEVTDILISDVIIKRGDDFKFLNNVKYKRDDSITLNTDELFYNDKTGIAKNTLPFDGTYFKNYIEGKNIYLDLNKYYMTAKDTHFEIEVEKK